MYREDKYYEVDFYLFLKGFYLIIFREGGRVGEKHQCERETPVGCLSHNQGPGPQPRYMP